jgi:hypothetical protein
MAFLFSRVAPIFLGILAALSSNAQSLQPEIRPKTIVSLQIPTIARLSGIQGDVELIVSVLPTGEIEKVRRVSGSELLASAAPKALNKWLFTECTSQTGCEVKITFTFILEGSCSVSQNCPQEFQVDLPDHVIIKASRLHAIVD